MSDETREAGGAAAAEPAAGAAELPLPRIDFSTFVLSLGASVMVHLGLAPGPEGEQRDAPNLPLARQPSLIQLILFFGRR